MIPLSPRRARTSLSSLTVADLATLTADAVVTVAEPIVLPPVAAAVTAPVAAAAPPAQRLPKWSDMVLSADGGEIDVTRAQMLFFTVITALFVTLKIITGYAIPEIPDSFQMLMGISNGLYVSRKFV